jgi:tetratricopeptide (TPR) repeat protein
MTRSSLAYVLVAFALSAVACGGDPQKEKLEYVKSGDQYVADRKYAEAIVQYRNAVARDATFGEARFKLAAAYTETGDLGNALREYIRAADLMPDNVEAQLRAGNGLIATGQYPEARARAVAALTKEPRNVKALILLGNAMAGMKDLDGAIEQAEAAVESDPHLVLSYTNLGSLELAKGDRAAAENTFKRAVETAPQSLEAHAALANFYWASGRNPEAEQELQTTIRLDPKSTLANRALALFYSLTGRQQQAELYLKAYAQLSDGVGPKLVLADYYIVRNRTKDAVEVLQPQATSREGFVPANLRLAAIAFSEGRRPEAYATLDEVLKQQPNQEDTLLEKGRFLLKDKKAEEALRLADLVVTANPRSIGGYYLKGLALRATQSLDDAAQAFRDALKLAPASTPILLQLAEADLARGARSSALEFATQVIKREPQSAVAHLLVARAQLQLGNVAAAEREMKGFARSLPNSPELQSLQGELYAARNNPDRARAAFERALELRPDFFEPNVGLVGLDLSAKKLQAATARVDGLVAKNPESEAVLLLAGNTYRVAGDLARAESAYTKVIERYPSNIQAYRLLAGLYVSQQRIDEARAKYEEVSRRAPKPVAVAAITMVATLLSAQGKNDEARAYYEKALALDPNMAVAANNLAWDYAETNRDLDVALKLAQIAKARFPDSADVGDTLGWVYYKKGLHSLAISSLEEANRQAPTNPVIQYHLGMAHLKNGDPETARRFLERALKTKPDFKNAGDAKRELEKMAG